MGFSTYNHMLCLDMERFYKKVGRLLAGILLLQAVLVFLHLGHVGDVWPPGNPRHELGEFWPFSIYPMFSQGGRPWVRSHVREVTDASDLQLWRPRIVDELPGAPYVMDTRGIDQNDIANFISKSRSWDARRVAGIRSVFEEDLKTQTLMIYRVDGSIEGDSVSVVFTPFLLMAPDTTFFNPTLTYPTE